MVCRVVLILEEKCAKEVSKVVQFDVAVLVVVAGSVVYFLRWVLLQISM